MPAASSLGDVRIVGRPVPPLPTSTPSATPPPRRLSKLSSAVACLLLVASGVVAGVWLTLAADPVAANSTGA